MKGLHKLIFSCVILTFTGCHSLTRQVANEATPKVVESGLESASEPANREILKELFSETPITVHVGKLNGDAVDTVIARLAHPDNEAKLQKVTREIVGAATRELRHSLPGLVEQIASNPAVKKALNPLSRSAGAGAVKGVADTIMGEDDPKNE